MFLASLDETQKDAFLALAASVVLPAEAGSVQGALWQEWLAEMGLPPRTRVGWNSADVAARSFTTARDRTAVMLEVARLSWETTDEAALLSGLDRVGALLGCSADEMVAVRDWARRLAALKAEAVALISARCAA